ncbi:MAG: oligosaccharide flippase family protein [Bacteroidia bacterium]|nr:oligosaccharide flippase family protein [Bacteroidia bacterium]
MGQLRTLAGQTAIYGLSSIVGRLLNYLLVPLYTRIFAPAEYGVVSEFYAYITFLMVLYALGLETAFFHFSNKKLRQEHVFGHAQFTLLCSTGFFTVVLLLFSGPIATGLGYPEHPEYIRWFACILAFDTLATLPFAKLRQQNKAMRFALIKLLGIFINIGLNLFFLLVLPGLGPDYYRQDIGVGYVFIANLAASGITLLLLLPEMRSMKGGFQWTLIREMLVYGFPLLIAGFAGMINETLDRAILKYLISDPKTAMEQLGIYSACYKLSILMTLFVQTFRYAAEPFYFSQQHKENSRVLFSRVMNYFVLAGCVIFLGVMFYMDIIKLFIGERYHSGLGVVPILLAANLFLGIYLNLSIWYKLSGKTGYGAWLSILGALITIVFNLWLIPTMGYTGAAWATLICYTAMMLLSYLKGQQVYPVPYESGKILLMLGITLLLWQCWEMFRLRFTLDAYVWGAISFILLLLFFGGMWRYLGGIRQLPAILRKK